MGNIARTIKRNKTRLDILKNNKIGHRPSKLLHAIWYLDIKKRDPRNFDDIAFLRRIGVFAK